MDEVDVILKQWRQGDVVQAPDLFICHLANLGLPLTPSSQQLAQMEGGIAPAVVSSEVFGLVILSQTCDIVRSSGQRPYVEVCALVKLPDDQITMLQKGWLGRYAPLPGLEDKALAADLDRVMTIEKGLLVILAQHRDRGVVTEDAGRRFAEAVGRKRMRAALPDDLAVSFDSVRKRIIAQHGKDNPVGRFLRGVKEIRANPRPNWESSEIDVEILFVFDTISNIPNDADEIIEGFLGYFSATASIISVEGRATGLDNLSAATYLQSDRLDFERLSITS